MKTNKEIAIALRDIIIKTKPHKVELYLIDDVPLYMVKSRRLHIGIKAGRLAYAFGGLVDVSKAHEDNPQFWNESGFIKDIDQAFELLNQWILNKVHLDEMPEREVVSRGSNHGIDLD